MLSRLAFRRIQTGSVLAPIYQFPSLFSNLSNVLTAMLRLQKPSYRLIGCLTAEQRLHIAMLIVLHSRVYTLYRRCSEPQRHLLTLVVYVSLTYYELGDDLLFLVILSNSALAALESITKQKRKVC